jgi:hypothetical protein
MPIPAQWRSRQTRMPHKTALRVCRSEANLSKMSVQEVKEAVLHLNLEERAEVAACLHLWNDDEWDELMKRDLASGKLDKILVRVDADIAENKIGAMP